VDARIAAEFERRFVEGMKALRSAIRWTNPRNVGPLATPAILEALDQQVRRSVARARAC
jgi:hypothetical protein